MQVKQSTHKVFRVTPGTKSTTVRIGDSRKKADNTYENCYWNAMLVGSAHAEVGSRIKAGDKLVIVEGVAFLSEYQGKTYGNVTVFKAEVIEGEESSSAPAGPNSMPAPPPAEDPQFGYDPVGDEPF